MQTLATGLKKPLQKLNILQIVNKMINIFLVHIPTESKINEFGKLYIPSFDEWDYNPNSAFLHYCDNETVEGLEFQYTPKFPGQLLVTDVSSNFLTRPMEWDKLDILYSHG